MDVIYEEVEKTLLVPYIYPSNFSLKEGSLERQFLGLSIISIVGSYQLFLFGAFLTYLSVFDRNLRKHPLYLMNQEWEEVKYASWSLPFVTLMSVPFFLLEVRGHSKLYNGGSELVWIVSIITLFLYTDCMSYWVHRFLHTKALYKRFHKQHHAVKIPSPFTGHVFHPVDGFLNSLPFHSYAFLFPINKWVYFAMFIMLDFHTILLHAGLYTIPHFLNGIVCDTHYHTDHHMYFNYNFCQYLTFWDRFTGRVKQLEEIKDRKEIYDVQHKRF